MRRLLRQPIVHGESAREVGSSGSGSDYATHSRIRIKSGVERHDAGHALPLHGREVDGVARRVLLSTVKDGLRSLDVVESDGKHFVDDAEDRVERRLNGVAPIDGYVAIVAEAVQYLHHGV